jgi:hypothetical protein
MSRLSFHILKNPPMPTPATLIGSYLPSARYTGKIIYEKGEKLNLALN